MKTKFQNRLVSSLEKMAHWYAKRGKVSEKILPAAAQPPEIKEAMLLLEEIENESRQTNN